MKRIKTRKRFAVLMAAAILLGIFGLASCGKGGKNPVQTAAPESKAPLADQVYRPNVPAGITFKGADFDVLGMDPELYSSAVVDFDFESDPGGDVVSSAIFKRNRRIESDYDIVFRSYYDAIEQLNDEESGKFIKRICNYTLYNAEDTPSKDDMANVMWEAILPLLEKATEIEKTGKIPYYLNRRMQHFSFRLSYANMIKAMTNNKNAGVSIKAMCDYMFYGKTPDELPNELQGAFNIFKKTFDISKARSESGKKGGKVKKKSITLAKIREDFPEITGKLHENNPVLDGVDFNNLYKFIQKNAEVRQLNMYGIVEKYKQNKV